jgi:hypothetical protein
MCRANGSSSSTHARPSTREYVNTASGLELHQFKWLESEALIGDLPMKWNHLVGVDQPDPGAALVHYTIGGPYFQEYRGCEFTDEWLAEHDAMLRCDQRELQEAAIG